MGRNTLERLAIKQGRRLVGFPKKSVVSTPAVDPPSINAGATGTVAVTVSGAAVSRQRKVVLVPPGTLEAGLVPLGSPITGTDQVTLALENRSGGVIDGASRTWTAHLFRRA